MEDEINNEIEEKILKQTTLKNETDFSYYTPLEMAQKYFGFNGFKENGQKDIIYDIMYGDDDVMGIVPTGGGKSACFQIPALIQDGLTIVVSPLIALMKDQFESLFDKGIGSVFLFNSSIREEIKDNILDIIKEGKAKILYVSPESLQTEKVKNALGESRIKQFVIDEAHCISTWGHDFRPSYLKMKEVIESIGNPKVLAFTATATQRVIEDIKEQLKRDFKVFKASFDRPNLYLATHDVDDNVDKLNFLVKLMKKLEGPTIIYARTIRLAENISDRLNDEGVKCLHFHGRLEKEKKEVTQNSFMRGDYNVIAATKAFGMGVDKKDIRNIIHYNIPQSVEDYYQEVGRAGRDGEKSNCILLYTPSDVNKTKQLIASDWPEYKDIKLLKDYMKEQDTNPFFTTPKSLSIKTNINEISIKLILHKFEESKAIKRYFRVMFRLKVLFNENYRDLVNSVDDGLKEYARVIFNTPHLRRSRTWISFESLIKETGLSYFKILKVFEDLIGKGCIEKKDEELRDLIKVNKTLGDFDITPLSQHLKMIRENKQNKVDKVVEHLHSKGCIRKNILSYFGEEYDKDNCEMCSSCVTNKEIKDIPMERDYNFATDQEINRLEGIKIDSGNEDVHTTILKGIAIDKEIEKKDFVRVFIGNLRKSSSRRKFNFQSYAVLCDREESELQETLDNLISEELVQITPEDKLRITKKGINSLYQ